MTTALAACLARWPPTCRRPHPAARSCSRAGCTAAASWRGHVPGRARPHRPGPGGRRDPRACDGAALRRGDVVEVTGTATANPQAPGGVEVTEPAITLLGEPAQPPPVELWRPALDAGLPTLLDHAAGDLAASGPAGALGAGGRVACAASGPRSTGSASPRSRRRSSWRRRPSPAPTCSGSTTSAARPTSPRARSSTSSRWSASSSASTRSGRSSGPSRTTPSGTSPSTSRSTSSSASSATTATCWRCCARRSPGWSAAVRERGRRRRRAAGGRRARGAGGDPGAPLPRGARARGRARRTSPTSRPRTSGRSARGRARARQRLPRGRGLPDGQAAVLHPPAARRPALVQQLRPALPRPGAGHRRPAAAPARGLRWRPSAPAARTRPPTRRTSRRSGTACRRTAGSRSGSSAGSAG